MPTYKQKNLGYKRTPTKAMIRCEFENGKWFDVPLQIIADSRDENYKDEKEDTIKFVKAKSLDNYEFIDWFSNNMNWSDVAEFAIEVPHEGDAFDYESEFCTCEQTIEGEV